MVGWDESAGSDVGYTVLYYCTLCQNYFNLSPIAPLRCPDCFCDARYILGPLVAKEMDLDKLLREQRRKYGPKMRR
jgi:hypothetical protein